MIRLNLLYFKGLKGWFNTIVIVLHMWCDYLSRYKARCCRIHDSG